MKFFGYVLAITFLVGCSTTPVSTSDAIPVPKDRIYEQGIKYQSQVPNSGQVVIKRDAGTMGWLCTAKIFLNSIPVADLEKSEKVSLYLPEGEYIISADPEGLCGGGLVEVSAKVKAGSIQYFRYGFSGSGYPVLFPTAF